MADSQPKRSIEELIEASSLGTPEAKALRDSVPDDVARAIVARSKLVVVEMCAGEFCGADGGRCDVCGLDPYELYGVQPPETGS